MKNIVGVRLKNSGKLNFFDPQNLDLTQGTKVIVDTSFGEDIGEVVVAKRAVDESKIKSEFKKVYRIATKKDLVQYEKFKKKEPEAFKICQDKIKKYKLEMNLVDVEYKFDGSKVLFYFTADGRIDFRELVKDLATIFKTRIELRQIGVRDEVKRIGGNGVCGRALCCCTFLDNFETVSIKMAKEQNISLNPSKISGNCGRLMCCLKYEQGVYSDKIKKLPGIGAIVKTPAGEGVIENVEILNEMVKVKIKEDEDFCYKKFKVSDIEVIKSARGVKQGTESKDDLKALKELERLDKLDRANKKSEED